MRCDGDKSDCIREQLNKRAKLITQARSALNDKFGILKEKISALKDLMERGCGGSLETLIKRPDLNCVFSGREMESVIVIMAFIEKSVNSIIGRINCISEVTSTNYQLGCADASALKPYIVHNSEVLIDMIDKMTVVLNRRITGEAPEFSGARSTTVGRAIMAIIRASKRLSYWTWTNKFKIAAAILAGYALLSTGAAVGSAMMLGTIKAGMATDLIATFTVQYLLKKLCKWAVKEGLVMALALFTAFAILKFVARIKAYASSSATKRAFVKLSAATDFDMDALSALEQEMKRGMRSGTPWLREVISVVINPARWGESAGFASFVIVLFVFYKFLATATSTIICTWIIGIGGSAALGAGDIVGAFGDVVEAGSDSLHEQMNKAIANFRATSRQTLRELSEKWGATGSRFVGDEYIPPFLVQADGTIRWKGSLRGYVDAQTGGDELEAAKKWMREKGSAHQKKLFEEALKSKEQLDEIKEAHDKGIERFVEQKMRSDRITTKFVGNVGRGFMDAKQWTDDKILYVYDFVADNPFLSAGSIVAIWGLFSYWYKTYNVSRSLRERGMTLEKIERIVKTWASATASEQNIDVEKFRGYEVVRDRLNELFVRARAPTWSERAITGLTHVGHLAKKHTLGVKGSSECKCRTACDSGWCYIHNEAKEDCEKKGKRVTPHRGAWTINCDASKVRGYGSRKFKNSKRKNHRRYRKRRK